MRLSILAALPLVLVGCGNPCERFQNLAESRARECGSEVQEDTGSNEQECTEEDAEFADCASPCYRTAPCGAFDGSDMPASVTLLQCTFNCAQAQQ